MQAQATETAERIEVRPQPGPQEMCLASPADIVIYGGQAGGGKTWALLLEPTRHHANPDFGAVIFRRTYKRITQEGGMWDESANLYPHLGARPNQQDHAWTFPSGARVQFAHMQHEKDRLDWKGAQVPLIGFDQVEEFTERQFWYMLSRNRSMCGVRPYIRATCNPVPDDDETGGWLHTLIGWWIDEETGYAIPERSGVVRWFVRAADDTLVWADSREALTETHPDLPPKSLTFIPARLEDNPALERADPSYRANLMALSKVERERLLGGNWKIRPTAGVVFNRAWFDVVDAVPRGAPSVRYWDKAATEGGGALSAGVKMTRGPDGVFYLEDAVYGHWSALERERVIRQTAEADKVTTRVVVEQEPGSGGKESAEATIRMLAGYDVRADRPTGDKLERAQPMSAQAEAGNVKLRRGAWNETMLRQLHRFAPGRELKDLVDAAVGAFNHLAAGDTGEPVAPAGLDRTSPWRM
ncbi:MAG: phage terminase large subunit [Gemmatimonadota bacterium]